MFSIFKKLDQPEFIHHYLILNKKKGKTYVVFDCETTGLNNEIDDILSISGVKLNEKLQIDVSSFFQFYILSDKVHQGKNVDIHEIIAQDLSKAVTKEYFIKFFIQYIENSILVGHFIQFDIQFVNRYLYEKHKVKLKNSTICTLQLSIKKENNQHRLEELKPNYYQLFEVCKRWNIPANHQHTSEGDVLANALLFQKLISIR
jgi:DNA polymerase-3 subunit epsilon